MKLELTGLSSCHYRLHDWRKKLGTGEEQSIMSTHEKKEAAKGKE